VGIFVEQPEMDNVVEALFKLEESQVNWSDGGSHSVENLANSVATNLVIELKG